MVWVMVDIGPIMAVMVMVDGPIMAVMVMVVILQLRTFNKRTARKQRQNHRPTIGTTAAIRKAIIPNPYVKKCPDGWLPVAPQPTASTVVIAPTAPTTQ